MHLFEEGRGLDKVNEIGWWAHINVSLLHFKDPWSNNMGCMTCIWCDNSAPYNQLWWDFQNKQVMSALYEYMSTC